MNYDINQFVCNENANIRDSIEIINKGDVLSAFVVNDNEELVGIITDGDLRRAILKQISLDEKVTKIMNKNPKYVYDNNVDEAIELIKKQREIKQVPVLNKDKILVDVVTRSDVFLPELPENYENKVCIMAGGKGKRLAPLTDIIPKPLIPVGGKPIIERVMDRFSDSGFNNFEISINYKGDLIQSYLESHIKYNCYFIREKNYLGTAGSLYLLKNKMKESFFVTNSDVFVDVDFADMMKVHKKNKNDITLLGVLRKTQIPYGVIEISNNVLNKIDEKPSLDYVVNGGIYILEPHVLDYIKDEEYLDMPNFLNFLKEKYTVGVYPHSGEWVDMGDMDEYKKINQKLGGTY